MRSKGFIHTMDVFFRWVTRLAFVNVLWILFSILGLGVAGIFPATVAGLGITRKWLMGEKEIPIWKAFKTYFKSNFLKANLTGWLLSVIGVVLYLNYHVINQMTGDYLFISIFAFYLVVFFYFLIVIWVFPLLSHYEATIRQQIKNAFILGVGKIHYSLLMLLWLFVVLYISLEFPSALIFFTFSISMLGWSRLARGTLIKLDKQAEEVNERKVSGDL